MTAHIESGQLSEEQTAILDRPRTKDPHIGPRAHPVDATTSPEIVPRPATDRESDEPALVKPLQHDRRGLGEMMLLEGLLTTDQLDEAIRNSRQVGKPVFDFLLETRQISESALADAYSKWLGVPRIPLADTQVEPEALEHVTERMARRHQCVPVSQDRRSLSVAMGDPSDFAAIQEIQFASGLMVRPLVATRGEIHEAIERYYSADHRLRDILEGLSEASELTFESATTDGVHIDEDSAEANANLPPVILLCNGIMQDAVRAKASDVHIEPTKEGVMVRMRVDGVLREHMTLPRWLRNPVAARFKVLSSLDIAERRLPQDGRIKVHFREAEVDIRVSTLRTHFGEKIVMRFLGTQEVPNFQVMGMSDPQIQLVERALGQPQGMILVTGPTGSGKTTALYSMLMRRLTPEENIITIEDPVEFQIPGVNQVQVHEKAGLTYGKTLRSILRQDPDVVMVGEIRDLETAEIAFRAAMTGHLVMSTLHTNGTIETITRLTDLGVDPVLIVGSLNLLVAQRLVRRLCPNCKEEYTPSPEVLDKIGLQATSMTYLRGAGCTECAQKGFVGRLGLFELLPMTDAIKALVSRRASQAELHGEAKAQGVSFLLDEGIAQIRKGITNPDEIARVVSTQVSRGPRCPSCQESVEPSFRACPFCAASLSTNCGCGMSLQPGWKVCPQCLAPCAVQPGRKALGAPTVTGEDRVDEP